MSTTINWADLSPEQQNQLLKEAKEQAKKEKESKVEARETYKKLSEDFVNTNIDSLIHHHEITGAIIEKLWADFESIKAIKADAYGNRVNEQSSHTSTLEDGSASITVGWNVSIGFDGTEAEGVVKIKDFINSLSTDQENVQKLSKAVNAFLKPNGKTGMLNPAKIIELSKLKSDFNDERFDEGLEIIFQAQQRRQTSMFVSGWKVVAVNGIPKKIEFRFSI